jgi:tetratricopeptide (TPR) repeat protein
MSKVHIWGLSLIGVAALAYGLWSWRGTLGIGSAPYDAAAVEKLLFRARTMLGQKRLDDAAQSAESVLELDPDNSGALMVLGEVETRQSNFDRALDFYARIDPSQKDDYVTAQFSSAEILRHEGRLSEAEKRLRGVLALAPSHTLAHRRLAEVLNLSGRRWEAVPHLLVAIRSEPLEAEPLLQLGNTERLTFNAEYIERCRRVAPDDPLPTLAAARVYMGDRRWNSARSLLQRICREHPGLAEAQVQLGTILHETGDDNEFLRWRSRVPKSAQSHPDLWALWGSWLRDREQPHAAAHCYREAVRRDPNHRVAVYQLSQLCQSLGRTDEGELLSRRAELLQQFADCIDEAFLAPNDPQRIREAAGLARELGRGWEAVGWAQWRLKTAPEEAWAQALVADLESRLPQGQPRERTVFDAPVKRMALDGFPPPAWPVPSSSQTEAAAASLAADPEIRFEEVAGTVGIDFQYFNSADESTAGMRMFEFTGGGVAALDYDRDGWTDLYFTQGCDFPVQSNSLQRLDALYRNRRGERFDEVAAPAQIVEERYSQGAAAGDFNSDGFTDLYIANAGRNRLLLNNGDGSFSDASDDARLGDEDWTTSCAMVDLDDDGHPDLYDVNYLKGEALYSRICQEDGVARACMPTVFDPEPDDVWISDGGGGLKAQGAAWELERIARNGLGIVAADFDESGSLDLFVANDAMANTYFPDISAALREKRPVTDQAVIRGLAFDRDGKSQACMGVASGDADCDGLLDLFVTNYFNEANTLYRQQAPGAFADATQRLGLRAPSYALLGFGTQFVDADLDGREDLILVNGHVDDFTHQSIPYRMRPQFLQNRPGGFVEAFADTLGEWFAKEQLGRSVARLDWNRDGRDDLAVSHLDTPAALLANTTDRSASGNFLSLRLVGVKSNRDAIGAIVKIEADGLVLQRHLAAGDGYQSSNERRMTVGLGPAEKIDRVTVRWLGGIEQSFEDLPVNSEQILVEGEGSFAAP